MQIPPALILRIAVHACHGRLCSTASSHGTLLSPSLKLHTPSLTQLGKTIEPSQEHALHVHMQTQNG